MATKILEGPRHHVRLWVIYSGKVVGSAHYKDSDPDVISFRAGENKVASYYDPPSWTVYYDYYYLNNYVSSPYNDGYATRVLKG